MHPDHDGYLESKYSRRGGSQAINHNTLHFDKGKKLSNENNLKITSGKNITIVLALNYSNETIKLFKKGIHGLIIRK